MAIALARRYRPRQFADLLVQDHVAAALRGAVAKNRVGHGYLLTGPRGVGKTTAARILAMALNCDRRDAAAPTGEPCGECEPCLRIWNGAATLDVVEIDAASNRGVDDARDLRERAMYAASQEGHHKVYIVDEAHMLTREAWNALLKVLEEPPPGVVFVFATTEPQKIANTAAPVMSRLQRFDFRRIGPAAIQQRLQAVLAAEGIAAEDEALLVIARQADGGMRDALSVLDQCLSFGEGPLTVARVREMLGLLDDEIYARVLRLVAGRQPAQVFPLLDQIVDAGGDLTEFAGGLADLLRALVLHHYGSTLEGMPTSLLQVVAEASASIGAEDAVRMLKLLSDAEPAIRRSQQPRLVLETLLLRWAMLDRVADLRSLLSGAPLPPLAPSAPEPPRARAEPTATPEPVAAEPPAGPAFSVPATTAGVAAVWGDICTAVSAQSYLLGQALGQAQPTMSGGGEVLLTFPADAVVYRDGVERQLGAVATAVGERLGRAVTVRTALLEREGGRPGRLSGSDFRADRLQQLRATDPALDAAVDALDLELIDEG